MELEKQGIEDRLREPDSLLSRWSLWGQGKFLPRKEDPGKGRTLYQYSPRLLFLLILIIGLNVLDSLFTMLILDSGGREVNPIVRSGIDLYGDRFYVWKFFHVSVNVILLCLYSRFRYVQKALLGICIAYLTIVIYQIILLRFYI